MLDWTAGVIVAPPSGRGASPVRKPRSCLEGPGHACTTQRMQTSAAQSGRKIMWVGGVGASYRRCEASAFNKRLRGWLQQRQARAAAGGEGEGAFSPNI